MNTERMRKVITEQQRGLALGYLGNVAGAQRCDLTDEEIVILILAGTPDNPPGHREQRVNMLLDMSMTTFTQRLNALIEDPRAHAFNPTFVNGLRRLRDERMARRGH